VCGCMCMSVLHERWVYVLCSVACMSLFFYIFHLQAFVLMAANPISPATNATQMEKRGIKIQSPWHVVRVETRAKITDVAPKIRVLTDASLDITEMAARKTATTDNVDASHANLVAEESFHAKNVKLGIIPRLTSVLNAHTTVLMEHAIRLADGVYIAVKKATGEKDATKCADATASAERATRQADSVHMAVKMGTGMKNVTKNVDRIVRNVHAKENA